MRLFTLLLLAAPIPLVAQLPFYTDDTNVTEVGKVHFEFFNEFDALQPEQFPDLRQNTSNFKINFGLPFHLELDFDAPHLAIFRAVEGPASSSGIGDADMGGREMLMALTGLNARGYKNSTLLFSLARIFIAHSPARALINPPWTGIAEPMWQPMQIRHRSAYYDAFFIEALLSYLETGLASGAETAEAKRAVDDMVDFCIRISREEVR